MKNNHFKLKKDLKEKDNKAQNTNVNVAHDELAESVIVNRDVW